MRADGRTGGRADGPTGVRVDGRTFLVFVQYILPVLILFFIVFLIMFRIMGELYYCKQQLATLRFNQEKSNLEESKISGLISCLSSVIILWNYFIILFKE